MDDAASGEVKVCCFVDDNGWVTWSCDDGSFAAIESSTGDGRSPGNADQSDLAMFEELLGCFEGWFTDQADDVVDTNFGADGLIESPNTFGSDFASARVRVYNEGIATSDHTYGVTGDGR